MPAPSKRRAPPLLLATICLLLVSATLLLNASLPPPHDALAPEPAPAPPTVSTALFIATALIPLDSNATTHRQALALASWALHLRPRAILVATNRPHDLPTISAAVAGLLPEGHPAPPLALVPLSRFFRTSPNPLPYLPDILAHLRRTADALPATAAAAHHVALAYFNADMVFSHDLAAAIDRVHTAAAPHPFLFVGRRTDLAATPPPPPPSTPTSPIDAVYAAGARHGTLARGLFLDFFVFSPHTTWSRAPPPPPDARRPATAPATVPHTADVPDFVVGRPRFDNWLVANAAPGVRVVDVSGAVTAVHLDHGYAHAGVGERREGRRGAGVIYGHDAGKAHNEEVVRGNGGMGWTKGATKYVCVKMDARGCFYSSGMVGCRGAAERALREAALCPDAPRAPR